MKRESFSSRIGFILISAGCAIGLGNVWRFPFITGQYGGASFVLIYLCFLLLLGLPIMVAEFAVMAAESASRADMRWMNSSSLMPLCMKSGFRLALPEGKYIDVLIVSAGEPSLVAAA